MLQFTPLLFITNAGHAFARKYIFYAILLLLLTALSVAWHSSPKFDAESMNIFWMQSPTYKLLLAIFAIAAVALSVYLMFGCNWDREYPTEHATFHGIASLCIHCVIAGL